MANATQKRPLENTTGAAALGTSIATILCHSVAKSNDKCSIGHHIIDGEIQYIHFQIIHLREGRGTRSGNDFYDIQPTPLHWQAGSGESGNRSWSSPIGKCGPST